MCTHGATAKFPTSRSGAEVRLGTVLRYPDRAFEQGRLGMADVVLTWERFGTFRAPRIRFRRVPCIYVLTDRDGKVMRVGESDDLWHRYNGGTAGWWTQPWIGAARSNSGLRPRPTGGAADGSRLH
jgi:hypothetical protein